MAATWKHPKLGTFKYTFHGWSGVVDMPAFKAFSYDTGCSNARRSTDKHEMSLEVAGDGEVPSGPVVALAETVLANQTALVAEIARALWDDFNGRGPASGMWWHGKLDDVAKSFEYSKLPRPNGPDDVLTGLQVSAILVRRGFPVHEHDRPLVEIDFHAAFEEEHGVGVLTDGQSVLGTGYSLDVTPFGYKPQRPRNPFA